MNTAKQDNYVRWFEDLNSEDVGLVGGKNASLGEMDGALKNKNILVPEGFATTTTAYRAFIKKNQLQDKITKLLKGYQKKEASLKKTGQAILDLFKQGEMPEDVSQAISSAYEDLAERYDTKDVDVAARSSATAEDMPEASFAGQQESFLNVSGITTITDPDWVPIMKRLQPLSLIRGAASPMWPLSAASWKFPPLWVQRMRHRSSSRTRQ